MIMAKMQLPENVANVTLDGIEYVPGKGKNSRIVDIPESARQSAYAFGLVEVGVNVPDVSEAPPAQVVTPESTAPADAIEPKAQK